MHQVTEMWRCALDHNGLFSPHENILQEHLGKQGREKEMCKQEVEPQDKAVAAEF